MSQPDAAVPVKSGRFDTHHIPGGKALAVLLLAFLYLPLCVIVAYAFNKNRVVTIWRGFSTKWFAEVWHRDDIRSAMSTSLQVAVIAMVFSVILAFGAALGLVAMARKRRGVALVLIGSPLVVPEIISAVATLSFFVLFKIELGRLTLIAAHTAFCIPFAFLPMRARLADLDPRVFEAAVDLGARHWQVIKRVTLPLLGPGVISGALLAFIISLDDYLISSFVAGPGNDTLPVFIFGMIRNGISPAVNALSTMLLVVSVVVLTLSYFISNTSHR
jgi:spermidine/putrescine transport system permease protein